MSAYILPQTPIVPRVNPTRCQLCPTCVARSACRTKALARIDREDPPIVDPTRCLQCWACVPACPHHAIEKPVITAQKAQSEGG